VGSTLANGETISFTGSLSRASGENIGTYAINQHTVANSNYTITYVGADLTITPLSVTVTADAKSKVYGEVDPALTFVSVPAVGSTLANGEKITFTGSLSRAAGENIGSYAINQHMVANSNYTITYVGADLTITPLSVTVTADAKSKVYGEVDPALTFVSVPAMGSTLANGETISFTGSLSRAAGENIGTYAINQHTVANSNYTISYVGADLTITPLSVTVTSDAKSKVYGEVDPALIFVSVPAVGSTLANGETISFIGSLSRASGENVGRYAIGQGTVANSNYTISYIGADFEIRKKSLVIRADDKQRVYGEPNPALTFTYIGLVSGETKVATEPAIGTAVTANSAVGTYPILLTGAQDPNYEITLESGTLTVLRRTLRIIAENVQKLFDLEDPEFGYTVEGLMEWDTVVGALSREPGEEVGIYAITLGTFSGGDNYEIVFTGAEMEILALDIVEIIELGSVVTDWGATPVLPEQIVVVANNGKIYILTVDWNTAGLHVMSSGTYTLTGTVNLTAWIMNTAALTTNLDVIVRAKPLPRDIRLVNDSFMGSATVFFIPVGSFIVDDPIDSVHEITLLGDGYDNKFFEIRDNILFWSSSDPVGGKDVFTIVVQVRDRDGNIITQFLEVTRVRPMVEDIEVFNSFTPDGDGVNDSWGIFELRYYEGARISVFERSGKRVFYTEDPDVRWDCTYNVKELPVGTYYWVLEVRETGETRRGMLNLLRK
jgi:gliding motility-associated-like protein